MVASRSVSSVKEYVGRNTPIGFTVSYNGRVYAVLSTACDTLKVRVMFIDSQLKTIPCETNGGVSRNTVVTVECDNVAIPVTQGIGFGELLPDKPQPPVRTGGSGGSGDGSSNEDSRVDPLAMNVKLPGDNISSPLANPNLRVLIAEPPSNFAPDCIIDSNGFVYRKGEITNGYLYVGNQADWEAYQREQASQGIQVMNLALNTATYSGQVDILPQGYFTTEFGNFVDPLGLKAPMGKFSLKVTDINRETVVESKVLNLTGSIVDPEQYTNGSTTSPVRNHPWVAE